MTGLASSHGQGSSLSATLVDAGDFYLLEDGREVHLLRAEDEITVRYAETVTPEQGVQNIEQSYPDARFDRVALVSLHTKGYTDILKLSTRNPAKPALPDVKSIAARPFIKYASHVLMDPVSNSRMKDYPFIIDPLQYF